MKHLLLSTILGTALLGMSSLADAATIDGAINADNRFAVAVTQNGLVTNKFVAPSNYSWGTTQRFNLNIDTSNLKQCYVNVIVWGDNSVREGFVGTLKGNNGTVYTGSGKFSAKQSNISSGGVGNAPSDSQIQSMSPATASNSVTLLGSPFGHSTWGNLTGKYNANDFDGAIPPDLNWIQPTGAGKTTNKHWVFSTPCGNLVDGPRDMPGEHFQCYNLEKGDRLKSKSILIRDQFGQEKVVLGKPRMLCNPSSKVHNDKRFEIRNKERHLVCYNYRRPVKAKPQAVKINNQFGPDEVVATRDNMFCVPSSKEHTDKTGNPKDTRYERTRPVRPAPRIQRR